MCVAFDLRAIVHWLLKPTCDQGSELSTNLNWAVCEGYSCTHHLAPFKRLLAHSLAHPFTLVRSHFWYAVVSGFTSAVAVWRRTSLCSLCLMMVFVWSAFQRNSCHLCHFPQPYKRTPTPPGCTTKCVACRLVSTADSLITNEIPSNFCHLDELGSALRACLFSDLTMMLAYPSFMQRHPHFAAAAVGSSYPQALPAFPQFSSAAVTSPPMPVAAFALQAQIPSPVLSPPAARGTVTVNLKQESDHDSSSSKKNDSQQQQQQSQPKSSFSIESILARDSDKSKNKSADSARRDQPQAASPQTVSTCTTSLSPVTPLSAGPKPPHNGFYYFYPPATQAAFPFTTPQSCLESELHRMHGRLSAPVAVISEIVRNAAGMLCILSIWILKIVCMPRKLVHVTIACK